MTYLKKLLIAFCLLASASFAEASGVISEQTQEGKAKNRRIELLIEENGGGKKTN